MVVLCVSCAFNDDTEKKISRKETLEPLELLHNSLLHNVLEEIN